MGVTGNGSKLLVVTDGGNKIESKGEVDIKNYKISSNPLYGKESKGQTFYRDEVNPLPTFCSTFQNSYFGVLSLHKFIYK